MGVNAQPLTHEPARVGLCAQLAGAANARSALMEGDRDKKVGEHDRKRKRKPPGNNGAPPAPVVLLMRTKPLVAALVERGGPCDASLPAVAPPAPRAPPVTAV